jgi:hypothetical protein
MNSLAQDKEQFNFSYSPFEFTDNSDLFLNLANDYYKANPIHKSMTQHLDSICVINDEIELPLTEIKKRIHNEELSKYLDIVFEEAVNAGIKSSVFFGVWIQGNNKNLNHPRPELYPHTHLNGDLDREDAILTHTVIFPLQINNEIKETFWAKWIDDLPTTIPTKLKILMSLTKDCVSKDTLRSVFNEWWRELKETPNNEMLNIKLPNKGEKLTINFNSRNYIHGINNLSDNLYLIAVFDGYTK